MTIADHRVNARARSAVWRELVDADGQPRPAATALLEHLRGLGLSELQARQDAADLEILAMGVTFTVDADGRGSDRAWLLARQCRLDSPRASRHPDLQAFAAQDFVPGRSLDTAATAICQRVFEEFEFVPGVTDVGTPVLEVLAERRGVCQDFALLLLGALRSLGLGARYVSGYLETQPPPGWVAWRAPTRRTRGSASTSPATGGSTSTRPTGWCSPTATSPWPGGATTPTWSRCAGCCSGRAPQAARGLGGRGPARLGSVTSRAVIVVGLTGGIGSGKSTVSALLARRGAVVVDADAITHQLQQPGTPVFRAMVERFGPGIVAPDGTLDRAAVADIVFQDAEALADLNAIVHPAVGAEIVERMSTLALTDAIVILDVPLLVESAKGHPVDGLLVVDVDPEVAVQRLVEQRNMHEADARARMARQASRADRLAGADRVIRNDRTLNELEAQVDDAWSWIEKLRDNPQEPRR
jgi:dephospho-CoA kinase